MIKLFATDLDGTLLNSKGKISDKNKKAFKEMMEKGVTPTISTGRMYSASKNYAEELNLDVPIITYNGALIKSTSGKVFYKSFIAPEIVLEIFQFCRKKGYYFQSYENDNLYFEDYTEYSKFYENHIGVKGITVGSAIDKYINEVPKLLIITSGNEESDKICKEINEEFYGKVTAAKSLLNFVEILSYNTSKAKGLSELAKILNIKIEEILAIGDGNNDIPMLKAAGFSVAMGNAKDEVKQFADAVVSDCDNDGVAEAVYKFVLK